MWTIIAGQDFVNEKPDLKLTLPVGKSTRNLFYQLIATGNYRYLRLESQNLLRLGWNSQLGLTTLAYADHVPTKEVTDLYLLKQFAFDNFATFETYPNEWHDKAVEMFPEKGGAEKEFIILKSMINYVDDLASISLAMNIEFADMKLTPSGHRYVGDIPDELALAI